MNKSMWISMLGTVLMLIGSITMGFVMDSLEWPVFAAMICLSLGGFLKGLELEREG